MKTATKGNYSYFRVYQRLFAWDKRSQRRALTQAEVDTIVSAITTNQISMLSETDRTLWLTNLSSQLTFNSESSSFLPSVQGDVITYRLRIFSKRKPSWRKMFEARMKLSSPVSSKWFSVNDYTFKPIGKRYSTQTLQSFTTNNILFLRTQSIHYPMIRY